MRESEFEGSLVLEKLAAAGKLDDFYEAVEIDDFAKAKFLLKRAGVDAETIAVVLQKMESGED